MPISDWQSVSIDQPIVSHAFGIGELVDAIILGLGVLAFGLSVFEGIDALYLFGKLAIDAQSFQDLDDSTKCERVGERRKIRGV